MNETPSVTLVVLNWNGRSLLPDCLHALQAFPAHIVVVDNASSDDSVALVRQQFPQVELLLSSQNLGFAGGNNLALRRVQTEFVGLVNPDVILQADWLEKILAPMLADPTMGIAGCKLFYPGQERLLQYAGGYITPPLAMPGHYGLREPDTGQHDLLRDVGYVIGAACLVRRTALAQAGLLDEGYFLYYEDVDWCAAFRQAGYRVVYVPEAVGIHLESASTQKESFAYLQRFHTGRWRFMLKHYAPEMLVQESFAAEKNWPGADNKELWQALAFAYREVLGQLPAIWQNRVQAGEAAHWQRPIATGLQELIVFAESLSLPPVVETPALAQRPSLWAKIRAFIR